jgi:urease accessory protein
MNPKRVLGLITTVLALPATALAHPGHEGHELTWDFGTGAVHPLTGWDHLLAMIAIGLWAVQLGGRARWLVPSAFVAAMALGAALGRTGMAVPGIEQGIAASLLVLGLMIATTTRMPAWAGMALAAWFACFHGFAHGAEAPANSDGLTYGAGFMTATACLHLAGFGLGTMLAREQRAVRLIGGAVGGAGLVAIALG